MVPVELYRDRWISCTQSELVIRGYYFPLGGEKHIAYRVIKRVDIVTIGWFTGRGRLWGTASPRRWAHLDWGRARKHVALVLDVGVRVHPFVTPDDPLRVKGILDSHTSTT